jgi:two-component system LytT family sensor kinase/two-component system sensor histidine kinase LytS
MDLERVISLLFDLFKSMSVIVTFAYILSRINTVKYLFNESFAKFSFNKSEKVFLIIFFSVLSILGTYLGIVIMDAYANIRAIGAFMAGLIGGPIIGAAVGITAGLHRFSLGGFTSIACAIGTTITGIIGSYYHQDYKNKKFDFKKGFLIGVFALTIEMIIVLIFSRPFSRAVELVRVIAVPMILSNSIGIAIFINILNRVRQEHQRIRAVQAEKVLSIADRSLPLIQNGLDQESAEKIIEMIKEESGVDAAALTDNEIILAFSGAGSDHHLAGKKLKTEASKKALKEKKTIIIDSREKINCSSENCPLSEAVVTPLKIDTSVYGLLKLYRSNGKITVFDIKLAEGIADLLATQIKLVKLSKQAELKSEAELKALQAQVNPHFLFNSINAAAACCRKKPSQARELLIKLAGIFRRTLQRDIYQTTLFEEINFCKDYLSIEKVRLDKRLEVEWNIPEDLFDNIIPPFIIQPLIENSIEHGIYPKEDGGKITISAEKIGETLKIKIEDNGIGMEKNEFDSIMSGNRNSIGIKNIRERLGSIYGSAASFKIDSSYKKGFRNTICIPSKFVFERRKAN